MVTAQAASRTNPEELSSVEAAALQSRRDGPHMAEDAIRLHPGQHAVQAAAGGVDSFSCNLRNRMAAWFMAPRALIQT